MSLPIRLYQSNVNKHPLNSVLMQSPSQIIKEREGKRKLLNPNRVGYNMKRKGWVSRGPTSDFIYGL